MLLKGHGHHSVRGAFRKRPCRLAGERDGGAGKNLTCLGTEGGRVTSRECVRVGNEVSWRWSGAMDEAGPCRKFKRPFLLSSKRWVTRVWGDLGYLKAVEVASDCGAVWGECRFLIW